MATVQYTSASNIQSNLDKASLFISQENAVDAMGCVALASSELTRLLKNGESAETLSLSASLQQITDKVKALYGRKLGPVCEATTTAKGLFPLRVFYQTEPGDTIELYGEE